MGSRMEIDAGPVLSQIETLATGAVASFFRVSQTRLGAILEAARADWPVASGTSRDSLRLEAGRAKGGLYSAIAGGATRSGWPVYRIKFSAYSQSRRDEMLAAAGAEEMGRANSGQAAGQIQAYFQRAMKRRIARFGQVPPAGLEGKQPWRRLVLNPGKAEAYKAARELQDDLTALAVKG